MSASIPPTHYIIARALTPVIDLVVARINGALEQLLDLLLAHLLAQIGENVLDLALSDEAGAILVKDLKAPDILFDIKGLAEAAGAIEDFAESFKVDCGGGVSGMRGGRAKRGRGFGGRGWKPGHLQSAPTPRSRSPISASVGF
jgi:hypothetical protein